MVTRGFLFEKNQETGKIQLNHNGTNEFTLVIFPLFVDPGYKKT